MCGPENTNRPRGGALAVLSPLLPSFNAQSSAINADLAFHTPGSPSSAGATHARLTPTAECDLNALSNLHVIIHSSGDLRQNARDCGLFRHFALPATRSTAMTTPGSSDDFLELQLNQPLSLQVGNDGVIGRRVSLCSGPVPTSENVIAQGIVGFNFLQQQPQASL